MLKKMLNYLTGDTSAAATDLSQVKYPGIRDAVDVPLAPPAGAFARATSVPFRYAMNPSSYFTRSFRPP